jgi:YVTN family beta-propeller protein
MKRLRFAYALICACLLAGASAFAFAGGYHLLRKIPLAAAPGGSEYFDYITFDAAARRVYVSHGTEVKVLNADNDKLIGDISGMKRNHGVAIVADLGKGFITDGDAAEVVVFDLKTLKVTGHIATDKDSDSILYDPASKHIFCFMGDPNKVAVIDPSTEKVITTLPMGGAPEQAVADGKGMIFDNLEDKNEVAVIDSRAMKITARWPVAPAGQPVSMAMDRQTRRLFIGTRGPAMFLMMDADSGKIIGTPVPISARVDTTVFDAETKTAVCSTGDGKLHFFHEDSPDKVSVVETVDTEYGAKTMALDPKTHNILVDTSDFGEAAANGRRAAKPGTFRLLVYGR